MTDSILIVVPARGGSKRLPGKNLAEIAGRSLIAHTATFLATEGLIESAIVSTDDPAIAEEARRCGLAVPFMRPAALATDSATTIDVVRHALQHVKVSDQRSPAITAVLQVTSPVRRSGLLREACALLEARAHVNSVVAMSRLHVPASYVFTQGADGVLTPLARSAEPALVPTGSLYVTRTAQLQKQDTLYAKPVAAIEVSIREAVDIDTPADLELARAALQASPLVVPTRTT